MTIKIFVDGEQVHEIDARAYRKRMLHMDFKHLDHSTKQEHIDLPVVRDLDIHLRFDPRADTDLLMLEEKARLDEADKDEENAAIAEQEALVAQEEEVEPGEEEEGTEEGTEEVAAPEVDENPNPVLVIPEGTETPESDVEAPDGGESEVETVVDSGEGTESGVTADDSESDSGDDTGTVADTDGGNGPLSLG